MSKPIALPSFARTAAASRHAPPLVLLVAAVAVSTIGCASGKGPGAAGGLTPETHLTFPIAAGAAHAIGRATSDGAVACASCHPANTTSFTQFSCTGCHDHEQKVTDRLHASVAKYTYTSDGCYSCHKDSAKMTFDHAGITNACAACHDVGTPFAALPKAGFQHPATNGADCSGCHGTAMWKGANGAPPDGKRDPGRDVVLLALIPTFSGLSMSGLTPRSETLPMPMSHGSKDVDAKTLAACASCHPDAGTGAYFPGDLHASLANLKLGQPAACASCHVASMPVGFVGPTATSPARSPASGEMKHDAVAWAADAPTAQALVSTNCELCHASPSATLDAKWSMGKTGAAPARYHAALTAAGAAQPASCLDCHANSRPTALLTSANAGVPAGQQFDHASAPGDCASCHAKSASTAFASWAGGQFHAAGSANPPTCLPCHAGERPVSMTTWTSATYKGAPFDYVTNAAGIKHGDGLDCATCHAGPGGGAWGGTQTWAGGHFTHGPATISAKTCIACHSTQRPDVQPGTTAAAAAAALGFDHAQNGAGECLGCHQATVMANAYVNYASPTTHALPGGDWKGGQTYPGGSFAGSADKFITVVETTLNRSGPNNLVTSTSAISASLYNGILHTSAAIPAAVSPGAATTPDNTKCWHCHTSTNTTVTAYRDGKFHAALDAYAATPGGATSALPQPTSRCGDCHAAMLPDGIVEKAAASVQPMDHGVVFASAVTLGGASVTKVADLDCSTCHKNPGGAWTDGVFHANVGGAVLKDCVSCHYMTMADGAKADVTSGTDYVMKHASPQLTSQACQSCHPAALAKAAATPAASTAWRPGTLHANVPTQPAGCLECHAVSAPAAGAPTASPVIYALALGATATNGAQWMNHGSGLVAAKDCAACHRADAKPTGSAWSHAASFHAAVPGAQTCQECHGLTNGGGAAPGMKNNLPATLTSTATPTSATTGATTGIPASTLAQVSHADVNVTGHDCNFCHTQVGASPAPGVAGKEWAQARFHANFTSAGSPLVMNTTSGRCDNCHLADRPGAAFAAQDHSAFTGAAGSQDCSACHSYPGTGTSASPNWLGAAGMPQYISVGGFPIPQPPAAGALLQTGITNLPHPAVATGTACTSCHKTAAGGRNATGYDHLSALINANCGSCHEAGSNLLGTPWNGATTAAAGAGDTRPFTIVGLVPSFKGNKRALTNDYKHFYPADCHECHGVPKANGLVTTGAAYVAAWKFNHNEGKMARSTCNMCHGSPNNLPGD
jgi:cytochrome c551/c552